MMDCRRCRYEKKFREGDPETIMARAYMEWEIKQEPHTCGKQYQEENDDWQYAD